MEGGYSFAKVLETALNFFEEKLLIKYVCFCDLDLGLTRMGIGRYIDSIIF